MRVGQQFGEGVTPFVIEWTPDLLARSRMGELRIQFEYGHVRNGHLDQKMTRRTFAPQPKVAIKRTTIHAAPANG